MRTLAAISLAFLLGACSDAPVPRSAQPHGSVQPEASPQTRPTPSAGASDRAAAPIPRTPEALAGDLVATTRSLKATIDEWRSSGTSRGRALLLALRQQRIYQRLIARPKVFAEVVGRLPSGVARFARGVVTAAGDIRSLAPPLEELPSWQTYHPAPANELRRYYDAAQRRFDVPWQILAAINFVETRFGRILGPSSAGAQGPMQFIPSTWAAYGRGDINDPRDSIMAAARYLRARGAPDRMRDALYSYNNSLSYVDAIQIYARQMRRDPRNFYAYYLWQVFVRTTEGTIQLTGPGGVRPAG